MFPAVIFGFKNKIFGLDSVIYGYVRSYTVSFGYVRAYTIIEGACLRSATHLATNGPYISLSVRAGIYTICFRKIHVRLQNERYGLALSSLACFRPYFHFKHAIFRHKSHIAPREWSGSLHIL